LKIKQALLNLLPIVLFLIHALLSKYDIISYVIFIAIIDALAGLLPVIYSIVNYYLSYTKISLVVSNIVFVASQIIGFVVCDMVGFGCINTLYYFALPTIFYVIILVSISILMKNIKRRPNIILLSLISILMVAVSWFMNFGDIRFVCLILLTPFVHAMIVFSISVVAYKYSTYRKIRLYNYLFCATYILSNTFFPDGDGSHSRMFFGLIDADVFMYTLGILVSIISLIMHIVLIVLQFLEISRINKETNENL